MLDVDRMITCTTRQAIVDSDVFRKITQKFFRLCKAKIDNFRYIAVFERHMSENTSPAKYGSLHLHVAINGFMNYKLLRHLWRKAVQDVTGSDDYEGANIDVSKRTNKQGKKNNQRIASYMAKYISKDMDDEYIPGKKRYWSSQKIPKPEVFKLYTVPALHRDTFKIIFTEVLGVEVKRVFNPKREAGHIPPIFWLSTI